MPTLQFRKATRKAVPVIASFTGVSGSGKTLSAILFGAGLAGPGGKVGLLDSENGRGQLYADSPLVLAALPASFEYLELDPPFTPARYIECIDAAEKQGINVLVIDSGSHEWEGTGGCADIAANDKNRWNNAKRENRKYVYRLLYSTMHIIVCLRAREKTKIIPANQSPTRREEIISLGILPVAEKNFVFEMLLSIQLEEQTHGIIPIKVPEPLAALFQKGRLVTKADGEAVRQWNLSGAAIDSAERLRKQARAASLNGMTEYSAFFKGLTVAQRKALSAEHDENKRLAEEADRLAAVEDASDGTEEQPPPAPEQATAEEISPEEHRRLNELAEAQEQPDSHKE